MGSKFWPKNQIFGRYDKFTLIFEDGIGQKLVFLDKKYPTLIFKLQKIKLVRIPSPIHWNHLDPCWIRIHQNCLDLDPDPHFNVWIHCAIFETKVNFQWKNLKTMSHFWPTKVEIIRLKYVFVCVWDPWEKKVFPLFFIITCLKWELSVKLLMRFQFKNGTALLATKSESL